MIKKMTDPSQDRDAVEVWLLPGCTVGHIRGKVTGDAKCTKITVYSENGEMARVPWVCVEYDNGLETRFPAFYAEITFDKAMSEEG